MSNVYVYDSTVTDIYSEEDFGSISSSPSVSEDYQQISAVANNFEDWYAVSVSSSQVPFGSIGNISAGLSNEKTTYSFVSATTNITLSSTLISKVTFTWDGNGTLFEIGSGLERTICSYLTSGTVRLGYSEAGISSANVSRSLDYNESSIVVFTSEDYGVVSGITTISTYYGDLTVNTVTPESGNEDYGNVVDRVTGFSTQTTYPLTRGVALTFASQGSTTYPRIYGSDFVTGTRDSGVGVSTTVQFKNYCNAVGFGSSVTGKYKTVDDYLVVYSANSTGNSFVTYLQSLPDGSHHYVNFDTGVASIWSSKYVLKNSSVLTSFTQLTEQYTYATFNIGGQLGLVFKLPDYVGESTNGDLGNINLNTTPYKFQEITLRPPNLRFFPGLTGLGTVYVVNGFSPQESYPWLPEPGVGRSWSFSRTSYLGNGTLFGLSGAVESFGANPLENTQLFTVSGISSTAEIQVYGINPGNHLYPRPLDVSSGIITVRNTALVHPFVDYTPHYGIEKNIGVGTTGVKLSGTATYKDTDSYVGVGTFSSLSGAAESITKVYDLYDSIIVDLQDWGSITQLPPYNGFDDWGLLSILYDGTEVWGPITGYGSSTTIPFGLFTVSGRAILSFDKGPYTADRPIYTLSGIASTREIAVYGYYGDDRNPGTSGVITLSANLVHPNIDYTPHYGIEENIGIGTTGIQITGISTAVERLIVNPPENTQLFSFSGSYSDLQFSANTPENTQLFTISGSLVEKDVDSYVGVGTLTISGTALEAYSAQTPENTQLFTISGQTLESYSAQTPENTQLFTISGELVHPNIDFTPHYGIEKNIGIGTTGIQIRIGVGYEPDSEGNPRDARTYSNRYPINDKVPGTGIGTITFDQIRDLAKYSPLTPYKGSGLFDIVTGFSPQESYPWLPGPGVGRSWSFTQATHIGSGNISIAGIASTREIAVYGYYGDDRDPGTSGQITISQQTEPSIEKETDSYVGLGTYTLSGTSITTRRRSYQGSGLIPLSGTALEVYSAQTPENTQLFSFSGTSLEVYSAQTPETEVLYIINGSLVERKTNSYNGSGSIVATGSATTRVIPNYPARGSFRFVRHTVDNVYDTCDSQELTCDNQDSANVRFVANPVENTILFNINGIASTREIATYAYSGIGTHVISGSYQNIKIIHSESGIGSIFITQISSQSEGEVYIGSGSLFTLSGRSESYSAQTPESTIILQISGSATTSVEFEYSTVGIGLLTLNGTATTLEVATFTQIGSGSITLSGQLVYPDIIFIPSPDGSGTINILGSTNDSLTKAYKDTSGSLFGFSSGFESFSRSNYIGFGTIYTEQISAGCTNNPFQIPRTYVVII
jgi:hypothetical protein